MTRRNTYGVGTQGRMVTMLAVPRLLTPEEAMTHAAWLVTLAGILDPALDFDQIRREVAST